MIPHWGVEEISEKGRNDDRNRTIHPAHFQFQRPDHLTEFLRKLLGSRKGAEALTGHLDTFYTALITEVEKYGSSVLSFS
jgi:hypothetical protein